ncbi:MAG: hypothetical protein DVB31_05290 [Verrucomicrobia bacterium]|nr:MAG: hypothetical protein DVB31_05290 [Verrucomicrobiota bacterium]
MSGLPRQKIAAYLAAVFVAGTAAGLAGGYQWGRRAAFRPMSRPRESMMQRITTDYQLRPDQVAKIEPIVNDVSQRMHQLQRDQFKQIGALMKECNTRMSEFLDADQKQRLAEREARHEKWLKEHQERGAEGRGGPAPGRPRGGDPARKP